jgi:hypothetical protein
MSRRDWIVHVKKLTFIPMLMYTIHDATITPAAPDAAALPGPVQMMIQDNDTIQDMRGIVARIAEQAGQKIPEAVEPAAPVQEDSAHPQENNKGEKEPASPEHDDMGEPTERLTKSEEERRRESPERDLELQKARKADLDGLLGRQETESAQRATDMDKMEANLVKRSAGSPQAKMFLEDFRELRELGDQKMEADHAAEVKELDEGWKQKLEEFEERPLIVPTVPERDRDDDDDR